MQYDVITLFPDMISQHCSYSIVSRGIEQGAIKVNAINPRTFTEDKHHRVDDTPYGGGAGMVLMCEPFFKAYESIPKLPSSKTIMLTPQGERLTQKKVKHLAQYEQIILLCGHYEGFDERIRQGIDLEEISIGDFVLTGGELGALCIIDATSRLVEGVLGKIESAHEDSFEDGLLEYPQYTKPYDFRGMKVPDVLLSGNHGEVAKWRHEQRILRTKERRPDLL
jgi:tRNA (guanine37-N1)-methyltransferase